jgi:hypothetical protein
MPVDLQWHASLPILVSTYVGVLSAREYSAMCDQRLEWLESGPDQIILLADTQQLEAFTDSRTVKTRSSILSHPKVRYGLIVLGEDFYRRLARAFLDARYDYMVRLYPDMDRALDQGEALVAGFGKKSRRRK